MTLVQTLTLRDASIGTSRLIAIGSYLVVFVSDQLSAILLESFRGVSLNSVTLVQH